MEGWYMYIHRQFYFIDQFLPRSKQYHTWNHWVNHQILPNPNMQKCNDNKLIYLIHVWKTHQEGGNCIYPYNSYPVWLKHYILSCSLHDLPTEGGDIPSMPYRSQKPCWVPRKFLHIHSWFFFTKTHSNISIFNPKSKYMTSNINYFYFYNTIFHYEYMQIPVGIIPDG